MLHLRLEVAHADVVEVLDLGQRGARDDVATLVDALHLRRVHFALLHVLLALLHLRQGSCVGRKERIRLVIVPKGILCKAEEEEVSFSLT